MEQGETHDISKKSSPPGDIYPLKTQRLLGYHALSILRIIYGFGCAPKIPRTIKGPRPSVSHVCDYCGEWQGTGDTKRPGSKHLSQGWQVAVTPGAGPCPSPAGISRASCQRDATLLSLTLMRGGNVR
uniref:Uncharacterized protein n=1 Tax=Knipowitschia caucasica TaxID=637954 RepID=A0AAV2LRV4_KNICA